MLNFVDSEITSHSNNLIGLAVILFAYLTAIFESKLFPQVTINLYAPFSVQPAFNYFVIFVIFWILNSGIIFTVLRLIYYGKYTRALMDFKEQVGSLADLREKIRDIVRSEEVFGIRMKWVESGIAVSSIGLTLSFF